MERPKCALPAATNSLRGDSCDWRKRHSRNFQGQPGFPIFPQPCWKVYSATVAETSLTTTSRCSLFGVPAKETVFLRFSLHSKIKAWFAPAPADAPQSID